MTEAAGGRRAELKRRLIERSLQDESFRQRLLADPHAALEEELGARLPDNIEIRAVEETADTIYLVLPNVSPAGEGGEISDQALDAVAGGLAATAGCYSTSYEDTCGC
jgi:Nitrile hydratase, alpha chain